MMNKEQIQTVLDALKYMTVTAEHKVNDAIPNAAIALLQAALAEPSDPVYWQWRRKDKPWSNEYIFAMELQAKTDDSEVRKLFTHPASKPAPLPDLTDDCTPNHLCNGRMVHLPRGEQCDKCGEEL